MIKLLTAKQLAQTLQVTTRTIWRWSATGQMPPPTTINGVTRWSEEKIHLWLKTKEEAK